MVIINGLKTLHVCCWSGLWTRLLCSISVLCKSLGCIGKSLSLPIVLFSFFAVVSHSLRFLNGGKWIARGGWANSHDSGSYCFCNKLTLAERVQIPTNEKSICARILDVMNSLICAKQQWVKRKEKSQVVAKSGRIVLSHSDNSLSDWRCVLMTCLNVRLLITSL